MKYTNTFGSMPTYGQLESGLFKKPTIIKSKIKSNKSTPNKTVKTIVNKGFSTSY
jgi:hypothetical protein